MISARSHPARLTPLGGIEQEEVDPAVHDPPARIAPVPGDHVPPRRDLRPDQAPHPPPARVAYVQPHARRLRQVEADQRPAAASNGFGGSGAAPGAAPRRRAHPTPGSVGTISTSSMYQPSRVPARRCRSGSGSAPDAGRAPRSGSGSSRSAPEKTGVSAGNGPGMLPVPIVIGIAAHRRRSASTCPPSTRHLHQAAVVGSSRGTTAGLGLDPVPEGQHGGLGDVDRFGLERAVGEVGVVAGARVTELPGRLPPGVWLRCGSRGATGPRACRSAT